MKTFIYFIVCVITVGGIIAPIPASGQQKENTVKVRCTDDEPMVHQLHASATIMENRLSELKAKRINVRVDEDAATIEISFNGDIPEKMLYEVLQSEGNLTFEGTEPGTMMTGDYIARAEVSESKQSGTALLLSFDQEGTERWEEMTRKNIGKSISIVLDGQVLSAPRVMDEIKGGKCMVTGDFSTEEFNLLKALVNGGKLPMAFEVGEIR